MSSFLQAQLSAFRGDVSASASKLSQKRTTGPQALHASSPTPSTASLTSIKSDLKRKRPESTPVVYSQPQDTGTGRHYVTQATYAIEYLKTKEKPVSFKDIFNYLSIPNTDENAERMLEHVLKTHPKIEYDATGFSGKGSYRFRPTHNVRSANELQAFLQRQPTAQGIAVRELKDGWTGAVDAIESLESEGKVLVTRNKKDNMPKMVWANDSSLTHQFDNEFQELWHKVKIPSTAADLSKELVEFGLTPTSQVKVPVQGKVKEKKKKANRRGGKTTNTHMANILKDFSHLRRA